MRYKYKAIDVFLNSDRIDVILVKYDDDLQEKIKGHLTHSYSSYIKEVDNRNLKVKNKDLVRIDRFLKSILYMLFAMLHKGEKVRAYYLIEELREMSI